MLLETTRMSPQFLVSLFVSNFSVFLGRMICHQGRGGEREGGRGFEVQLSIDLEQNNKTVMKFHTCSRAI
jgi:hypothetical protein